RGGRRVGQAAAAAPALVVERRLVAMVAVGDVEGLGFQRGRHSGQRGRIGHGPEGVLDAVCVVVGRAGRAPLSNRS
ncbi:hypothetical protein RZS08_39125, partial [Arthrospira platensis SPKY1]|nr:hypothetical protein [Arthrospira platensis SPKY1]